MKLKRGYINVIRIFKSVARVISNGRGPSLSKSGPVWGPLWRCAGKLMAGNAFLHIVRQHVQVSRAAHGLF